jgi:hypothetical protein
MKGLLTVMAAAYLVPMFLATILVAADFPGVRELQMKVQAGIVQAGPIPTIARFFGEGRLLAAIALTFVWNFGVAACIGSIAIGVLFPLPPLIAVLRGFLIGLVFANRLMLTFPHALVMAGTFLLEIGSYVLAGALGMRLGLAILPFWKATTSFRERREVLFVDFCRLLPVVAVLLLLGAIWENAGIFLLRRLP